MRDPIDRRTFLTHTALGTVALTLPRGSVGAVLRAGHSNAAPSEMFVSMPPWAVARNVGWPDQARLAARVGYAGIDWAFKPAKTAGVAATRALLAELAIEPTIVNLPMQDALGPDDAAFDAQLPMLDESAAFCRAIGCSRMQLVLGPTTIGGEAKVVRWALVQRRLSALSAVLAKHEVRLGLEFLGPLYFRLPRARPGAPTAGAADPLPVPVPFVWTLKETLALCEASGPNVGVTLDAWHWHHSGGTPADIRAASASRIIHVHVSDARAMKPEDVRDDMRLLPGEGVIDLIGFFRALQAIGYRGGVAPETIGPRIPDGMPPEESARLGLDSTLAVMRRAGVA